MTRAKVVPYGGWKSPITSDLIVSQSIGLSAPRLSGADVYWLEMRPQEGGRNVLVRRTADGRISDVTPHGYNVRTTVHEYGGGAFLVDGETVYFSNFADQRLYRQTAGGPPQPVTPMADMRFADGVMDRPRSRLICVLEDHTRERRYPDNCICAIPAEGGRPRVLVGGYDFFSTPRLNPDGSKLAWLAWNHPNMPWDGTELFVADVRPNGTLGRAKLVAGGDDESIFQPEWSPDGVLHFVSDRTGWWNLYRFRRGAVEPLCEMEAEFGKPQWVFGMSTYAFESPERILCSYSRKSLCGVARIETTSPRLRAVNTPYACISSIHADGGRAVFIGASPTESPALVMMDTSSEDCQVLRESTSVKVDRGCISPPQPIEFPTENGLTAHALFYAPANKDYTAPRGELPPLVVHSHGGPTSASAAALKLSTQYWTSRGIAVVDVNYGGSTGYGREYRKRLDGLWGVVDVDDCCNAARYLVEAGKVDGKRLAIAGGSAGGYTTLCALAFRDVFQAGASRYGVSDAETLAADTHKFESHYLDGLIGPYPAARDTYVARSPIHFVDGLSCPVIFFQGLLDKIVPPDQAEKMVDALRKRGLPVAYVAFEGEQHGFRRAENIKRALDGELHFYSKVFGFEPADTIDPVEISNLD